MSEPVAGPHITLCVDISVILTRPRWSMRDFDPSEARVTVAALTRGGWIRERQLLRDRENVYLVLKIGSQGQNTESIRTALTAMGIPDRAES